MLASSFNYGIFRTGEKMRSIILQLTLASLLLIGDNLYYSPPPVKGECTIGVFSGRATSDGRPILWKNRDVGDAVQKYCYFDPADDADRPAYSFIGNVYSSDTTRVYMGVNEAGFAVMNSNSYNLGDSLAEGINDGDLMSLALERCATLREFEEFLDLTAEKGRQDCWNIGALDASGNAALYECSNYDYVKFDANDRENCPDGIILRATYGLSGSADNRVGKERYKRANRLVYDRINEAPIDVEFILQTLARDLANPIADPYPLPYTGSQNGQPRGAILSEMVTINRTISRSCMVLRGVKPGEDPSLATSFCMIGPPVISVAFPLWVRAANVPAPLNEGSEVPMYLRVKGHRENLYPYPKSPLYLNSLYLVDEDNSGIYSHTLPLEREALAIADQYVDQWYNNIPGRDEVLAVQTDLAADIFDAYMEIPLGPYSETPPEAVTEVGIRSYPNPFNARATIRLSGFDDGDPILIIIYDLLGREIRSLDLRGGDDSFAVWDGRDDDGRSVASGMYLIRASSSAHEATTKTILMK
jgi:hypothetical protein